MLRLRKRSCVSSSTEWRINYSLNWYRLWENSSRTNISSPFWVCSSKFISPKVLSAVRWRTEPYWRGKWKGEAEALLDRWGVFFMRVSFLWHSITTPFAPYLSSLRAYISKSTHKTFFNPLAEELKKHCFLRI